MRRPYRRRHGRLRATATPPHRQACSSPVRNEPSSNQRRRLRGRERMAQQPTRRPSKSPRPRRPCMRDPHGWSLRVVTRAGRRRSQSDAKANSGGGVKWVRVPTAPSIPNVAQSFGYEEGPKGQMILQHPSKSGHSGCANDVTGPGEYDPLQALHRLACTRATSFAKSKTSRDSKHKSTVAPGPGFYHTETHPHPHAAVPSAVFKSTLTRERAAHSMARTTAAAVPGPGSYNSSTPQKAKKTVPEHLQFFGSTTSRFEPKAPPTSSMPATTSSTPVKPQSHHHNPHNVGFASSNKRFDTTLAKDTFDVGPGSYNAPGLVEELQHRVSGRTGVFGSTTKRFESAKPLLDTVLLEHDPRSNNQHDDTMSVVKAKSSAFASATSRFQSPAAKDPVPCPGDYNINLTWDKPGGKAVFASHMDRGTALDKKTAALPGPGSYVGPDSTMKKAKPTTQRKDVFMSTEPRFKSKLAPLANLGPGAYNPDTIETDWNRPTYNITIATEMEKRI
ncbi:hypothetical protein, variant [Aphanomyces invadans]|uniref:Uncharacterized protein n=1 Tax=Aphanomyces invadans TaxID=157072 RepID=A0A024T8Y8_9STRA|nr:hypothetical protein, variant [Aphanomyces invadans]ETV90488.1 hypothetical protein, variant [Aphanomyces invadans]|eukprot:XP_008880876.1 hypothetical protein, variant [Aphanomyces invadans]